ncbi:MAG: NAD-dependent epimerase/dehydratase family protein [Dehalococcoidia bacterium]|nr:NAD-dependent epimerase/dehydratase family protein [Dehalococcoidia bacterium]MDW8120175.1 NAD-dependent epimerase/dehydratase family protein [Chloroflexota bacterium]
MRALVTGGAGFIGSHLVDRLVREGFQVAVVDNLSTGRREYVHPDASFYPLDIRSPRLEEVFQAHRPQVVFHLAAQVSVVRSLEDPVEDASANILGSLNLLALCRRFGVERFIYSSTGGAVYGEPQYLPCPETHPIVPLSAYGASKYAVEVYLPLFRALTGFTYTALRYSNVYGPRQDPYGEAGVVAIFSRRMLDGQEVVIYGDGTQERDFVYVEDVVESNILALRQRVSEVYNIGTGTGTSVNALFQHLARLTGYQRPPRYAPPRPGEVYKIRLDVRKAQNGLGWTPQTDLEQGLERTVHFFRTGRL